MTNKDGAIAPLFMPITRVGMDNVKQNKLNILITPQTTNRELTSETFKILTAYLILSNASFADDFLLPLHFLSIFKAFAFQNLMLVSFKVFSMLLCG